MKTKGDPIYSPKISDDLIPALYRLGKKTGKPMTQVVDEILRDYLAKIDPDEFPSYKSKVLEQPSPMISDSACIGGRMTPRQIQKKLKSLKYRQRLVEGIEALESEILDICREYNTDVLFGYKIGVEHGHVRLYEIP